MRLSARTVVTAMDAQGAVIRLTAAQQSVAVTARMVQLMVVLNGASGETTSGAEETAAARRCGASVP